MPILIYTCLLFFLVLQACNLGEIPAPKDPGSDSLPGARVETAGDTVGLHRVADDRIAGRDKPATSEYRDGTGSTYLINPNWSILQRKPRTAAEANLPGTNGLVQTWADWSGQVETRIYECVSPTATSFQNSIGCQVEPDFILVGGGAWADYGNGAGAFIWESRPLDGNLSTWVASSKAHVKESPHYLHTYAIGMRLKDNSGAYIPKTTLLGTYVRLRIDTAKTPAHTQDIATYGAAWYGYWDAQTGLLIGGGARANWTCCGAFLTEFGAGLYPTSGGQLPMSHAQSKDHSASELHTLYLYSIEFKAGGNFSKTSVAIPNFGTLEIKGVRADGNSVPTGVAVAIRDADAGYVMTTLGAIAQWPSGYGRLLIGVKPTGTYSGQEAVYSKDHKVVCAGYSTANFSEVRKTP